MRSRGQQQRTIPNRSGAEEIPRFIPKGSGGGAMPLSASPVLLPGMHHLRHSRTHLYDLSPELLSSTSYLQLLRCIRSHKLSTTCKDLLSSNTSQNTSFTDEQLHPTASVDDDDVRQLYAVVVPVMLTACVVSLLFNLVIVLSVRWLKRTLSPTLYLSMSLALADSYTSLVLGVGLVVNSLLPFVYGTDLGPFNSCYILTLEAFRLGGIVISVLHLLALAINHYIGILKPLHYASTVTTKLAVVTISIIWTLPIIFFLVYFSMVPHDGFRSRYCSSYDFLLRIPFRVTMSTLFFVPLILMSAMYAHMFVVIRRHQKGLYQKPTPWQLRKNVRATVTSLLILGTYILGWMPAVMFFVLTCLDCPVPFPTIRLWVRVPVGIFINSMIVAKSFVDPIIYIVRMQEIKFALKALWRTKCGFMPDHVQTLAALRYKTYIRRRTFMIPKPINELGNNSNPKMI